MNFFIDFYKFVKFLVFFVIVFRELFLMWLERVRRGRSLYGKVEEK